jgi:multiple sugar transport system substrate-binding protein
MSNAPGCREKHTVSRRAFLLAGSGSVLLGPVLSLACVERDRKDSSVKAVPTPGLRSGVTLTFAHGGTDVDAEARREIFRAFEVRYPQIKVEHLFNPGDYAAKIQAMIAAGTPPDILYVANGADVTTHAARGALYELDGLARRDRFDASDMFEAALALYQLCGKQYAYPIDFPNQELYYNVDLFEQAGVELPLGNWNDRSWTFERFLDVARRLTRPAPGGGTQWGYLTAHTGFRNWWVWVAANGGELFDKDMKTCVINEPPAVEALQFLQDLVFRHAVMPGIPAAQAIGGLAGGALRGFTSGQVAMATLPPWLGQVRNDMKQRWDVAPHPRGNGPRARWACAGGGTGLALTSPAVGARNINEAWELLKFCESRPQVETYIRYVGIVPPLKSVANSPVFADPNQPPKSINVFTDGAQYLRADPSIVRWSDINQVIVAELARLWDHSQNARSVAESIKRGVDPILKEIQDSGLMACRT